MFESKSDIHETFASYELASVAASVERHLAPALAFVPAAAPDAAATPGASRLGGAPDLPADQPWPVRPAYAGGGAIADRLVRRPELRGLLTSPAPLHFMAQIDLAAVARLGVLKDHLPAEGRLLFFWDPKGGPWIESAESCRVLWDRTPAQALVRKEAPAGLAEEGTTGFEMPRLFRAQAVDFLPIWSMPDRHLLPSLAERAGDAALVASLDDEDAADGWEALWCDMMDARGAYLASGREVLPHRLGGWPMPEQDDPRYEAVGSALGLYEMFGHQPDAAERARILENMHRWVLLLQVDFADLWGLQLVEGTIYFVMREGDLHARNFDRVHAIYQQT
jgi:uncharacterized protein YwqG